MNVIMVILDIIEVVIGLSDLIKRACIMRSDRPKNKKKPEKEMLQKYDYIHWQYAPVQKGNLND